MIVDSTCIQFHFNSEAEIKPAVVIAKVQDSNRSIWDMAFNERPGPVILSAHYPEDRNRVVDRAGRLYRDILDERVREWKRVYPGKKRF